MAKRKNGEGSWGKKTINGYVYKTYRTPEGKTYYGKSEKEIKDKMSKQMFQPTTSNKITFGDYILEWLKFKQSEIEDTTYNGYSDLINCMIINYRDYRLSTKLISSLNSKVFQKYLNSLASNYSRNSIVKIWAIIKQCIKYGEIQGELPSNLIAMVKVPLESKVANKKKEIPFLTIEQADKLYELINTPKYEHSNNAHALILILYTGMRVGEAIALKWDNVENSNIHIVESAAIVRENGKNVQIDKAPKTINSVRWIPLPDRAIEMIEYFKKQKLSDEYVCVTSVGTKMNRRNMSRTLSAMCKDANLPNLNIHALRHSYGSMLLSQGVDIKIISELLGHSNISTTYDIYIGIKEEEKNMAVQKALSNRQCV